MVRRDLAGVLLDGTVLGADVATEVRRLVKKAVQGKKVSEDWAAIKKMMSQSTVPDHVSVAPHLSLGKPTHPLLTSYEKLLEQTGDQGSEKDLIKIREVKESWNKVLVTSACFQELVGDMQECAERIGQGHGEYPVTLFEAIIAHRCKLSETRTSTRSSPR